MRRKSGCCAADESLEIRKSVKIFGVGAMTVQVRVPFEVERLEDLVGYHDLKFAERGLEEEVAEFAESVRKDLAPYCVRPVPALMQAEAYTVFCLAGLPGASARRTRGACGGLADGQQKARGGAAYAGGKRRSVIRAGGQ